MTFGSMTFGSLIEEASATWEEKRKQRQNAAAREEHLNNVAIVTQHQTQPTSGEVVKINRRVQ
jgi:hypothetical protein